MAARVSFEVDAKDIARVKKNLQRVSGKSLYVKMQRASLTAGDLVARRMRSESPRLTGNLRRSISVRLERTRFSGATATTLIGPVPPRGAHRHLVIRGHRIVTPGGRYLGRSTRANPFVDRSAEGFSRKAADLVRKEWFR